MKLSEVPQDLDPTFEGGKKLCYAVDESGTIVKAQSSGWKVEETAKDFAWKVIETELTTLRELVRAGKKSPLFYYMRSRQMDLSLLAENMEISRIRAWWHLRPGIFRKMSDPWLQRYSECLEIPLNALRAARAYRGGADEFVP